jgi:hypothetical protein
LKFIKLLLICHEKIEINLMFVAHQSLSTLAIVASHSLSSSEIQRHAALRLRRLASNLRLVTELTDAMMLSVSGDEMQNHPSVVSFCALLVFALISESDGQ